MAKKKRKIKIGRVCLLFVIAFIVIYFLLKLINFDIKNIYISGNNVLTDTEIIEMAGLEDYQSFLTVSNSKISKKILKNSLVKEVNVYKKNLKSVYIEIVENKVLFYNQNINKLIVSGGNEVDKKISAPTLINYIPDVIYDEFVEKMDLIDSNILSMVSEIKYDVNEVDDERFLFYMEDGNYVYLTLSKLDKINSYQSIIKKFGNKKGIMYLDSGEYFKVVEN